MTSNPKSDIVGLHRKDRAILENSKPPFIQTKYSQGLMREGERFGNDFDRPDIRRYRRDNT
jgi:hypothetical protein